jgi:anti-sigma factor RsiW
MNCRQRSLVHAYADRELDLTRSLELEHHLQDCASCAAELQNQQSLKAALSDPELYYSAPRKLRQLLARRPGVAPRRAGWNWLLAALSAGAVAAVALFFGLAGPSAQEQLLAELTSSHVRSLMADHLADVASTDQHTVKPWFNGKIDFAPPVKDLEGFPLSGGRLDYVRGRPVAALIYQRHKHSVNLFIWPHANTRAPAGESGIRLLRRRGYNLVHWTDADMQFWAVSDLNPSELREFAERFGR